MKNQFKKANIKTLMVIMLLISVMTFPAVVAAANDTPNGPQVAVWFIPGPGTLSDYDTDLFVGLFGFRVDNFPEPEPPPGYVFVGWFMDGVQIHAPIAAIEHIALFAGYALAPSLDPAVSLAIVYEPGPGELPQDTSPIQSFTYGSALVSMPVPYRAGHIFEGWVWNDEPVTAPFIIRSDMVLEAVWAPAQQTVLPPVSLLPVPAFHFVAAFDPFPGAFNGDEIGIRLGRTGSTVRDVPDEPTLQGAVFNGWRLPNGAILDDPLVIRGDIALTAIWLTSSETGAAVVTTTPIETRPNPQTSPIVISMMIFGAVIFLGLAAFAIFKLTSKQVVATGKYRAAMVRYVREIRILIRSRR